MNNLTLKVHMLSKVWFVMNISDVCKDAFKH